MENWRDNNTFIYMKKLTKKEQKDESFDYDEDIQQRIDLAKIRATRLNRYLDSIKMDVFPMLDMKNEQIIKIGRVVYAKLFDDFGGVYNSNFICFQDKKGEYDCKQLFWRFYWITNH